MKLYRIRNWNDLFENNRSRTVTDLTWVKIPNRHDGENYTQLVSNSRGAEIFAAWVLILQVASRCQPRGTLLRGNKKPHDPLSLSQKTRAPKVWFEIALKFLEENTDWLDVEEVADGCQSPVSRLSVACQSGDEEGKGMEGNGMEGNGSDSACSILSFLNLCSGKEFREVESNLSLINQRLKEPGVTVQGCVQMVERQCEIWKDDEKMREYLRPATLFAKSKFDGYYAARELPVQKPGDRPSQNKRNAEVGLTINDENERRNKTLAIIAKKNAEFEARYQKRKSSEGELPFNGGS